jgi:chromosome partitioning protein
VASADRIVVSTLRNSWRYDGIVASSSSSATVLTVLNRKGGVGKTHLCWLIASVCQERGRRCLIVDLDPQANLSASFVAEDDRPTVEALFDPSRDVDIAPLIRRTEFSHIDIVPASPRLEPLNVSDPEKWARGDLHLSLADALATVREDYSYILCDCPPSLSLVSYAALSASDLLLVPLEAAQWGALGTQHVVNAMEEVQRSTNPQLRLAGYVVSRFKQRRAYHQAYLAELRRQFGPQAFETVVPDLAAYEKAVTDRIPITLHSPRSHASTIARNLFDELEAHCERLARQRRQDRRVRVRAKAPVLVAS